MLACENTSVGISLLDRFSGKDCDLLMISDGTLGTEAFEKYGFSDKLLCYQVAYYGEMPSVDNGLTVRAAEEQDLPVIIEHYHMIGPEELKTVVRRGNLFLGFSESRLVGFIGEHLEGSMGMLYIFPEYRQKGYGTALQTHLIAKTLEKGFVPFGQVEKNNQTSLNLQKKVGMTQSDHLIMWMWK